MAERTVIVLKRVSETTWVGHVADQEHCIVRGNTEAAVVGRLVRVFPDRFALNWEQLGASILDDPARFGIRVDDRMEEENT